MNRFSDLASYFGEGQAFAEHLRDDKVEAVGIVQRIIFGRTIVVAEHLLIDVTEHRLR